MSSTVTAKRERDLKALSETLFDMVIVGGGINGAAIARDATLRGYRVALIERNDFGFGTSSRSSRLIHGGLRYLEQGHVGLVFESVNERARLAQLARHLVRPLPFLFPVYDQDERNLLTVDMGLWLYDALALFRNYRPHQRFALAKSLETAPGLNPTALKGSLMYYDYQTNDGRLVLENVLDAAECGAIAVNYAEVNDFVYHGKRAVAVNVTDKLEGDRYTVRGRSFICATGPWTDQTLGLTQRPKRWLRPTKGVHIVVPRERLPIRTALLVKHPDDRRVHFFIPFHERTVLGTTDTDFSGDPKHVRTSVDDVDYLLASANHHFPEQQLTHADVISNWVGLRPLVIDEDAGSPSAVNREHRIHVRPDGIVVIAGGKLTTYRLMAAECVDEASQAIGIAGGTIPQRGSITGRRPLPGSVGLSKDDDLRKLTAELTQICDDANTARHLAFTYGTTARSFIKGPTKRIVDDLPFCWAEVTQAVEQERARTLQDVFVRRTQVFYRDMSQGLPVVAELADRMAALLGWSDLERQRQIKAYKNLVAASRSWWPTAAERIASSSSI